MEYQGFGLPGWDIWDVATLDTLLATLLQQTTCLETYSLIHSQWGNRKLV